MEGKYWWYMMGDDDEKGQQCARTRGRRPLQQQPELHQRGNTSIWEERPTDAGED